MAALERLHGIVGASEGPARLELVKLVVREEFAQSVWPFACEIDFAEVARSANTPLIDLEIEATGGGRALIWRIPADSYPGDTCAARGGQ